jgi:ribosomal protein S18 acetylase RimI-like enzyme
VSGIEAAATAIADSLMHEPFYQAITVERRGDPAGQLSLLRAYMAYSLADAGRSGRCVLADDPADGAAAWILPRTPELSGSETADKKRFLNATLGRGGCENYARIVGFMESKTHGLIAPAAWYLSILGVRPAAQGRGIGAKLLAPTLAEADRREIVCWVETFSERNRAFYRRAGFDTVATHHEPVTNASYAIMIRAAAAGRRRLQR